MILNNLINLYKLIINKKQKVNKVKTKQILNIQHKKIKIK